VIYHVIDPKDEIAVVAHSASSNEAGCPLRGFRWPIARLGRSEILEALEGRVHVIHFGEYVLCGSLVVPLDLSIGDEENRRHHNTGENCGHEDRRDPGKVWPKSGGQLRVRG